MKKRVSKSKVKRKATSEKDDYMYYPDLTSDKFYHDIYVKKEFNKNKIPRETRSAEDICTRKNNEFSLMPQQEFLRNYISLDTPYNGVLIFHGVGVGKTCSAISIAEGFKEAMAQYNKRILVILNRNVRDNFKNQIYDISKETDNKEINTQCTGFAYRLTDDMKYLSKEQRARQIQKLIRHNYKFLGYKQFANEVQRLTGWMDGKQKSLTDQMKKLIKKEYSNRIVIIDEIHNIKKGGQETRFVPPYLEAVIKYSKNLRLVMMSATPMYNSPKEFIYILNLLLLNDKKKAISISDVFNKDGTLKPDGEKILLEKSKGYISYLRGETPPTFPVKLYPSIANTPYIKYNVNGELIPENNRIRYLKLIECPMSKYQFSGYSELLNNIKKSINIKNIDDIINKQVENEEPSKNTINKNTINNKENAATIANGKKDDKAGFSISTSLVQMSDIGFPSNGKLPAYGKDGYIKSSHNQPALIEIRKSLANTKKRAISYEYGDIGIFNKGEKDEVPFLDETMLANYSSKFYKALHFIKNSKGIAYIYSEFVLAGVIPFAIMLEQNGFERYTVKGESQLLNYSPNKVGGGGKRRIICYKCGKYASDEIHKPQHKNYHKWGAAKYILVTGSSDATTQITISQVSDIMSSNTNKYGEEVKVIIGTRVAGEGINFKRIRQVHILEPWHNLSRLEQVAGRAVRFCSHVALPEEMRNVDIFMYAATPPTIADNKTKETETIDLNYYRNAENKDVMIKKVESILKRAAVDCALNKDGNTIYRSDTVDMINSTGDKIKYTFGDKPNTASCDYGTDCSVKCVWMPPKEGVKINKDTYSVRFALSDIETAKKHIRHLYRQNYVYDLNKIVNYVKRNIPGMEDIYIYKAINSMLKDDGEMLYDKYSQEGKMIYRGNYYIFQPTELNYKKIPLYYREHPVPIKKKFIILDDKDDLVSDQKFYSKSDVDNIDSKSILKCVIGKMIDLEAELAVFARDNNIKEFGKLVASMVIDRLSTKAIIEILKKLLLKVINNEEIDEYSENILDYLDKSIIHKSSVSKVNKSKDDPIIGFNVENIYFCIDKDTWKRCDATFIQLIQFRNNIRYKKIETDYKKNKIYGFLAKNSKGITQFKIFDSTKASGALTLDLKKSGRSAITGRVCMTISKDEQALLIDKLGMVVSSQNNDKDTGRKRLCNMFELYLRYYQLINYDKKSWFVTE